MPSKERSRPWGLTPEGVLRHYGWTITKSECWEFNGPRHRQGYGAITINGKGVRASRLAYQLWVGSVGDLHVLHKCDNPPCINPGHLFLGTQADNNADMRAKGRQVRVVLRGDDAPWSKLTSEKVRWIREQYALKNFTQQQLADMFDSRQAHISAIVNEKIWRTA